jgi:hypothetical protein
MPIDWLAVRADPIRAIEHGVGEVDAFETTFTGPTDFDRIDYPCAEVLPQSSSNSDGNEWTHRVDVALYFERERGYDYIDDVLHPTAWAIDECLAALAATESVVRYVPNSVEDYAGELDDTAILLVVVQFEVATLVDMADTSPNDYAAE